MKAERVYRRHLVSLKYCARGSREFFNKHGLSWSDFLRNGIERDKLYNTNDAMAQKAVSVADMENDNG